MSKVHLAAHRFLKAPPWAAATRSDDRVSALEDLSDLRALIPAHSSVRTAAKGFSALSTSRPEQWTLRDALARAHRLSPDQFIATTTPGRLWSIICRGYLDTGDRVAIALPQRDDITHEILVRNAAYVDIGRDQSLRVHPQGLERLLEDGDLQMAYFARPSEASGHLDALEVVKQCLHAGLWVVVDETQLHYADPMGGLPGPCGARSISALALLDSPDYDTSRLIVMRQVVGLDGAQLSYAVGEPQCIEKLWIVEPSDRLPAALVGSGWLALDQLSHARQTIRERLSCRDTLRQSLMTQSDFQVMTGQGLTTWLRIGEHYSVDVAAALLANGVRVASCAHHTWRDHIAFVPPQTEGIEQVIKAFSSLNL